MILLIQHLPDGAIHSVAFVPDAHSSSIEPLSGLPVLRIPAHDALASWKGEALSGDPLRQEVRRARTELREKYRVLHGNLVARE
jgi:hypothetical protein